VPRLIEVRQRHAQVDVVLPGDHHVGHLARRGHPVRRRGGNGNHGVSRATGEQRRAEVQRAGTGDDRQRHLRGAVALGAHRARSDQHHVSQRT